MIPAVGDLVLAFACESVPDPDAVRLGIAPDGSDDALRRRVVSVAMVRRTAAKDGTPDLALLAIPKPEGAFAPLPERKIVGSFLAGIGQRRPQLIGYGSRGGDLLLLARRAIVLGIPARGFFQAAPGRSGHPEYLSSGADCSPDLAERFVGRPFAPDEPVPPLRDVAAACGIPELSEAFPAPVSADGEGALAACTARACCRALTVYLLWLRMAAVAGHFDAIGYAEEQELLRQHLMHLSENPAYPFAEPFLEAWDALTTAAESIDR